jgi:hypothetical protein
MNNTPKLDDIRRGIRCVETQLNMIQRVNVMLSERIVGPRQDAGPPGRLDLPGLFLPKKTVGGASLTNPRHLSPRSSPTVVRAARQRLPIRSVSCEASAM